MRVDEPIDAAYFSACADDLDRHAKAGEHVLGGLVVTDMILGAEIIRRLLRAVQSPQRPDSEEDKRVKR